MRPDLKLFFFLLSTVFVTGCVTRAVQTEALLENPGSLPLKTIVENVEFIDQSVGYCGPATLTMALRWAGHSVTVDEIAEQVYTPKLKGSLQTDMISTARRNGMTAVPIQGLNSLFTEVAAGHPVIIFENLSLAWAPNWHYAIVLGFDLTNQEVILHSGKDAYYHWDIRKFERSWMLGEYWGLVILPAGALAITANELTHAAAAVGLEKAGQVMAAEKSYQKILQRWPQSLISLIGLANISYQKGGKNEAVMLLRKAHRFHPDSEAVKYNLAVAEAATSD